MNTFEQAQANLRALTANLYPGRGIVMGLNPSGRNVLIIYWIMGRGNESRNRLFGSDGTGRLFTVAADPSKMKDPSLIIYDAMLEANGLYAVSNGNQTNTLIDEHRANAHLKLLGALRGRTYEPDSPNNTSRITAAWQMGTEYAQMLILERSRFSEACDRRAFELAMEPGIGFCITTYSGDGNPLPRFRGDPILLPLFDAENTFDAYWNALNADNRVALAMKAIDVETGRSEIIIKNRFKRVESASVPSEPPTSC